MTRNQLAALVMLSVGTAAAYGQNLVTNGSFETGDFTGWTLIGSTENNFVDSGFASQGTFAAYFGEVGGNAILRQTIATNPGTVYNISFDFAGNGDNPSSFSAAFGGTTLFSVTNPPFDVNYVTRTFQVTATSTTADLTFTARDDLGFLNLDNVMVTAQAVPEPTTMAALALGALALVKKRARKN